MWDTILSMPAFYFYLMFVVAWLITALWTSETNPPVGEPGATALTTERGVTKASVAAGCNLDRAPFRISALPPQRDCRPFRNLQATLSASYAARLEQAIRTIRIGPSAETRPTDQAAE
jgi:hypothetical protein